MAEAVAREAPGLPCCTHSQARVNDHPVSRKLDVLSRFVIRAQVEMVEPDPPRELWDASIRLLALPPAEMQRWNGF